MTAHGPFSRARLLPSLLGLLLLLAGLAMLIGGIRLVMLDGSPYYLIGGLAVAATGVLLFVASRTALLVYGLFLLGSCVWALWEVWLDWWQLVPRLALWFAVGILLLLPWFRRPLGAPGQGGGVGTKLVGAGVAIAGIAALVSLFMPDRGEIDGELSHEMVRLENPAPDTAPGDWPSYGRTAFGQRYSPLNQITPENVDQLELAWTFRTGDIPGPNDPQETTAENTPLKVNGMLYVCTPHSQVIALNPDTGEEIWRFDPKLSTQNAESFKGWAHMTCRGVAYHDEASYGAVPPASPDMPADRCTKRIFLPTADTRLIALNADTGKPCPRFGDGGSVNLATGIGDFNPGGYYSTSPPSVARDLVIIGGHVTDNVSLDEPSGVIRAYDVRTGELVWNWDSGNPEETEPLPPGEIYTRNSPNMWSVMSVDEDLGLIYLPMGNATPDQWGGHRTPPMERFSAGITALDIATGEVRWVFQTTHHDLWDMDVGGQPSLTTVETAQGPRPALIASTKQGSIYVLDRRTGEPIIPVEERPVPQGAAKGDWAAPTQPFSKLDLQPPLMTEQDMWGVTPFDQMLCRIEFKGLRYDGIYTPPSVQGSLVNPGNFGVFDWGGVSIDPQRQIVFMNPSYMAFTSQLVPRENVGNAQRISEIEGVQPNKGAPFGVILQPLLSPLGLPCQAPAWGYIAAADLTTGEIIYKRKNGTIRDSAPIPLPIEMGVPSLGGTILTAGGVGFLSGTLDQYLRAYDVATGEELWKGRLPAGGQTTPMTYAGADGRQYVLVMAGGHGSLGTEQGDYVLAYRLPEQPQ